MLCSNSCLEKDKGCDRDTQAHHFLIVNFRNLQLCYKTGKIITMCAERERAVPTAALSQQRTTIRRWGQGKTGFPRFRCLSHGLYDLFKRYFIFSFSLPYTLYKKTHGGNSNTEGPQAVIKKKKKNSSKNSLHLSLAVSAQHNCHKNVTTCQQILSHLFPILN